MLLHVLERIREFRAIQDDGPSQVQPDHEEGEGRQDTVYGTLLGHHHLRFQIQVLHHRKGDTRYQGRFECIRIPHLGTWYILVHEADNHHGNTGEREPGQEAPEAFGKLKLAGEHQVQDVGIHHGTGEEQDYYKRRQHGNAQHDANHGPEIRFLLDFPDVVEHPPHRNHQIDHYPDEGEHGDEAEKAALCSVHNVVGRLEEDVGDALLPKIGNDDLRKTVPEAQAVRKVEANSNGRNHRHHAPVGQGRYLIADFLVREGVHHQDHGTGILYQAGLPAGEIVFVQEPDVARDEKHNAFHPDGNPPDDHGHFMRQTLEHIRIRLAQ